ncbi:uncharacterized protein LOC126969922 isoform X2 [Leptidea sinapis]|nr:uncharacterized protein LOC126969922 isoform X2 [Leptidea sinapis]
MAREQNRLDVLYILGSLLVKYTYCTAVERDRGLESQYRKYSDGSFARDGISFRGVLNRKGEEVELIKDLGVICKRYARARDAAMGDDATQFNNQKYINENFATQLNETLQNTIKGITTNDVADEEEEQHLNIKSIKDKAMKGTAIFKHQKTVLDHRENSIPDQKKNVIKPGKIKRSSPRKVNLSPRKRKQSSTSSTKGGKVKNRKQSNSTAEEDLELDLDKFDKEVTESSQTEDENETTIECSNKDVTKTTKTTELNEKLSTSPSEKELNGVNETEPSTSKGFDELECGKTRRSILRTRLKRVGVWPIGNYYDDNQ